MPLNPITFKIPQETSLIGTDPVTSTIHNPVLRVALNILKFLTIVIPLRYLLYKKIVPAFILPGSGNFPKNYKENLIKCRESFFAAPNNVAQQLKVTTVDNVQLDGIVFNNPAQTLLEPKDQKWIVWMSGNAMCYEEQLYGLKEVSDATGANLLSCNYRGVMDSQGSAQSSKDLQRDGEAMISYLLEQGIPPSNILVHGWSLGGAIATSLVKLYQDKGLEMHLCNDRSFSSFPDFLSSAKWLPKCLVGIAIRIVAAAGWIFNASDDFKPIAGSKLIIHAKQADRVIPYEASLYKKVKQDSKPNQVIKLLNDPLQAYEQRKQILIYLAYQMWQVDFEHLKNMTQEEIDRRAIAKKLSDTISKAFAKFQRMQYQSLYNEKYVGHQRSETFIEQFYQEKLINDDQRTLLKSDTLISKENLKEIIHLEDWAFERVEDSIPISINFHCQHLSAMGPYFLEYIDHVKSVLKL